MARSDHDNKDSSQIMGFAFAHHNDHNRHMKLGYLISLYFVLALIWLPGFTFRERIYEIVVEEHKPAIRKVLRPPPEMPMERVVTKTKKARRVPMPDLSPNDPEPEVEPDIPEPPEVLATDEWEIGIPDAPPPIPEQRVARVGEVGVAPPIFINKVLPNYPAKARSLKLHGSVVLEAILRTDGSVEDIKVLKTIAKGKFGFEAEAIKALQQWEFLPGKVNGRPSDVQMRLTIDFKIKAGEMI